MAVYGAGGTRRQDLEEEIMMRGTLKTLLVAGLLTGFASVRAGGQGVAPKLVSLDTLGMFQAKFFAVGDNMFIGGQPTERGLREAKARGVTTVVNLRSPEEMARVPFDEPALVKQLGMHYVYLPMRGTAELPYTPAAVKSLAAAIAGSEGKVLLHCTIAWRASHLWTAYLIQEQHVPVTDALASGRTINLMDNMRMGDGKQPLEAFLGHVVPEMEHPKAP
jgi:uncharacterized protein (TIGR01244 family)